jgi:hypothetical protein
MRALKILRDIDDWQHKAGTTFQVSKQITSFRSKVIDLGYDTRKDLGATYKRFELSEFWSEMVCVLDRVPGLSIVQIDHVWLERERKCLRERPVFFI